MRIPEIARRAGEAAVSLLFPPHCAACGRDVASGLHLCAGCGEKARRIEPPFCRRCSEPFAGAIDGEFECPNCADRDLHFDCAVAPFLSRGVVREFIHRLKYDRETFLRRPLAAWLAEALTDERLARQPFDLIVPVPLHAARLRERSFNQAALLAALLSEHCGVPTLECLRRIRYTSTQTRLDRHERTENLRGAFRVRDPAALQGSHLLLVDDVFTTGATVDECARVLRLAGAASVRVATVARG
jgi:ComF family protein